MSLALEHKRRILAERAAGKAQPKVQPYTPATAMSGPANAQKHLKLQELALAEDLERIADINSR